MHKTSFFTAVCLAFQVACYCQQSDADKKLLDSLIKSDDLLRMISSLGKESSYLKLSIGVSNKLFSIYNNSLNALEENRKIIFMPSLEYFHKSGFGISASGFLLNEDNKTGFFQYSLTPSFDYVSGDRIEAGIYYTRFFAEDKYNGAASPIQNDLYLYAALKNTWLKPTVSFGYSTGRYHETIFIDTTMFIQNRPVRVRFTDTLSTKIKSISLIASLSHIFPMYAILHSNDALYFIPQLSLNMGSNKYAVTHKSSTIYRAFRKKRKTRIRNFEEESTASHFAVESLGLQLDLNYRTGRFNFEPQLYLDYYLPATTEKRFAQIFSVSVGYMF